MKVQFNTGEQYLQKFMNCRFYAIVGDGEVDAIYDSFDDLVKTLEKTEYMSMDNIFGFSQLNQFSGSESNRLAVSASYWEDDKGNTTLLLK